MDRDQLLALKDRVEKAKGPSRDLGNDIYHALGVTKGGDGNLFDPCPTRSIDAALALVKHSFPDWSWVLARDQGFAIRRAPTEAELDSGKYSIIFDATCKTLALSIVAALLSAMIAATKKEVVDA